MYRGRIIFVLVFFSLVGVVGWQAMSWYERVTNRRLAQFELDLESDEPETRLKAAVGILRHHRDRDDVRMIQAKALMEHGRFVEAREVLQDMSRDGSPYLNEVVRLRAESCVIEASRDIEASTPESVQLIESRINELLAKADSLRGVLAKQPGGKALAMLVEARSLDTRSAMMRLVLRSLIETVSDAEVAEATAEIRQAKIRAGQLRTRLDEIDQQLVRLCKEAIAADRQRPEPYRVLVRLWLRRGEQDAARNVVTGIVTQPKVDRSMAGQVAGMLLNMEEHFSLETTEVDVELARQLLQHPNLTGTDGFHQYDLAMVSLHLKDGAYGKAEIGAGKLAELLGSPPSVAALHARALIGQGRADEAMDLLIPYEDRLGSPTIRNAMAQAFLQLNRTDRAIDMLRSSLKLDHRRLPTHLLLTQIQVDAGLVKESEPDIVAAANLSPHHSVVLGLQARLLVEKLEVEALADWMRRRNSRHLPPMWEDSALVAAMVLDDTFQVASYTDRLRKKDRTDRLAFLADAWRRTAPDNRSQIAAVAVQLMLDHRDNDPLRLIDEPVVPIPAKPTSIVPLSIEDRSDASDSEAAKPAPATKLSIKDWVASKYVPRSEELALRLVEIVAEQFQGEQALYRLAAELAFWLHDMDRCKVWLSRWEPKTPDNHNLREILVAIQSGELGRATALFDRHASDQTVLSPTELYLKFALSLQRDDDVAARPALRNLLSRHPWAQSALVGAIHQAGDNESAIGNWLTLARDVSPKMALLTEARWQVLTGQQNEAIHSLEMLVKDEPSGSDLRARAADLRARANLMGDRVELAIGAFDSVALSAPHRKVRMQLATADVLVAANRPRGAAAGIHVLLRDGLPAVRYQDPTLARAIVLLEEDRLTKLLDQLQSRDPKNELLLLYRARVYENAGQLDASERSIRQVLQTRPDAARAYLALARLMLKKGDKAQARSIYQRLMLRGGRLRTVAEEYLRTLTDLPAKQASPPPKPAE